MFLAISLIGLVAHAGEKGTQTFKLVGFDERDPNDVKVGWCDVFEGETFMSTRLGNVKVNDGHRVAETGSQRNGRELVGFCEKVGAEWKLETGVGPELYTSGSATETTFKAGGVAYRLRLKETSSALTLSLEPEGKPARILTRLTYLQRNKKFTLNSVRVSESGTTLVVVFKFTTMNDQREYGLVATRLTPTPPAPWDRIAREYE